MPSKKVLILAVSCFIAVGLIIVAVTYKPSQKIATSDNTPVINVLSQSASIQQQLNEADADNDGLKDWEEALWDTDKNKADTDGDGKPDGQEVKNGTDPRKKGPNDKLSSKDLPSSAQNSGTSSAPVSATQEAAQALFSRYVTLKQSGQTIDDATQAELINQILADNANKPSGARAYSKSDLIIASTESQESIKAYGNKIGAIIKNDRPKVDYAELALVEIAVDNDDPSSLAKIAIMVTAYQKMLSDLKNVSVPPSAAINHASLMTTISEVIYSDQGMQKFFTDPITAMLALQQYQDAAVHLDTNFKNFSAYFKKAGVTYIPSDPGYLVAN